MRSIVIAVIIVSCGILWLRYTSRRRKHLRIMRTIAQKELKDLSTITSRGITRHFTQEWCVPGHGVVPRTDRTIFVSVASYRDTECVPTINSMVRNATLPHKLYICVCLQDTEEARTRVRQDLDLIVPLVGGLDVIEMDPEEAKGPTWARYLIQRKWTGEQYYLQIDSHTRFVDDWDANIVRECPTASNVCLTTYISRYNVRTGEVDDAHPLRGGLQQVSISKDDGFLRFDAPYVTSVNMRQRSYGWAACFSFSSSKLILDAPYDPYTPCLFFGEEMDVYLRLWTRGWTFYAPRTPICFTSFDRSYRPTFWGGREKREMEQLSRMRIYNRLYDLECPSWVLKNKDLYSLGTRRSLESAILLPLTC